MPPEPLEPGDPPRLGRYELTGRLGEGGQGVVYLGRDPDGTTVAVKLLRSTADPRTLSRLARELDAVHQVQPFVTAKVIEAGTDGTRRYVVSEYIEGASLQQRVTAGGPLRDGELHRLAVGTATALTAIHGSGVVHRDFKPANVLLGPDGPRVVDFGIARVVDTGTTTSNLIGTPSYLSPEQLRGESTSPAVDVFAWAVTIVFAATGRPAFGTDNLHAVMNRILIAEPDLSGVPESLRGILESCLDKDPRRRPTARDLLVALVDPSAARLPSRPAPPATGPTADLTDATAPHENLPGPPPRHGAHEIETGTAPPTYATSATSPYGDGTVPEAGRTHRVRVVALVSGGVVVAALLGTGGWALFGPHHDRHPRANGAATPSVRYTPPVTASPPPPSPTAGGTTIPAAYAGTWSGTVQERVLTTQDVPLRVTLTAGARTGEAYFQDDDCHGVLSLDKVAADGLTFGLTFPDGGCVAGTVTLGLQGQTLDYRWHDRLGLATSQGPLSRTG